MNGLSAGRPGSTGCGTLAVPHGAAQSAAVVNERL
jgi:hypothetical protein